MNAHFYTQNRQRLLAEIDDDAPVVLSANGLMQRTSDSTFAFRQDSNFLYLTGLTNVPDAVLVCSSKEEYLILRPKSRLEDIFEGAYDYDEIIHLSGITSIYEKHGGEAKLKKMLSAAKKVYTIIAPRQRVENFYTNPSRIRLQRRLKSWQPSLEIVDIRLPIARLRQIKQPIEIEQLKHSIAITKQGFEKVNEELPHLDSEPAIQAVFDSIFTKEQAVHGYTPIVAGGARASTLHYTANNQPLHDGELVLLDIGAETAGYSADISRTYSRDHAVSPRAQQVFEAVSSVHAQAIQMLKPGLAFADWFRKVEEAMGQELLSLGLIPRPLSKEIRRYFPHSVSHSLGLDVHDICEYTTIQEHMVLTVEPGIYIPEEGIGIRIEDDVLIQSEGADNLSSEIPYYSLC